MPQLTQTIAPLCLIGAAQLGQTGPDFFTSPASSKSESKTAAVSEPAVELVFATLGIGTLIGFWQLGHLPFLPASLSGTLIDLPQLQLNLMAIELYR
ncbi:MAG: hypothetical protein KDB22_28945 [Planctomycetales bacterium]|nr:hypothetical protein [Planctomycetales bacterium]